MRFLGLLVRVTACVGLVAQLASAAPPTQRVVRCSAPRKCTSTPLGQHGTATWCNCSTPRWAEPCCRSIAVAAAAKRLGLTSFKLLDLEGAEVRGIFQLPVLRCIKEQCLVRCFGASYRLKAFVRGSKERTIEEEAYPVFPHAGSLSLLYHFDGASCLF